MNNKCENSTYLFSTYFKQFDVLIIQLPGDITWRISKLKKKHVMIWEFVMVVNIFKKNVEGISPVIQLI